jgi:TonB family protein
MPVYPGGQAQMLQDLAAGITYPKSAQDAGVSTKVFVGFVVGADGRLYDIVLKKGAQANDPAIAADLNTSALQAVKNLTKTWQPGRQSGKPVAVSYTLPIAFAP